MDHETAQVVEEDGVTPSYYAPRVPALGGDVSRTQVTVFGTATTPRVDRTTMAHRGPAESMQVVGCTVAEEGGRS